MEGEGEGKRKEKKKIKAQFIQVWLLHISFKRGVTKQYDNAKQGMFISTYLKVSL